MDTESTVELIERMKFARIGKYDKWQKIIKKLQNQEKLNRYEEDYFMRFTRIYKNSKISSRSKTIHVKLSNEDYKPKCQTCEEYSEFYCNQNDAYFCVNHIVGHDENER